MSAGWLAVAQTLLQGVEQVSWLSYDHVCAVYFPEKGDCPRLVWVRVLDRHVTGEPGSKLKVDCSGLDIAADRMKALQEWTIIKNSRILLRDIPNITWIGSFKYDGRVTRITGDNNTSVAAIDMELPLAMYGPSLFYALDRDFDATDCQNLVDDLCWRDYTRYHIVGPTSDYTLPTVESVIANCLGDTLICHQPDFAPYPLPADTLRQDGRALLELPIGALIGIPLVTVKIKRSGLPWRGRMTRDVDGTMLPPEKNRLLASIHPGMYKVQPGSLIVARKDEKPLLVVHVMALCRYCKSISDDGLLPTVRESDTSRSEYDECFRKRWELLKAKATPEGFRAS
jgi:hypothetical protein